MTELTSMQNKVTDQATKHLIVALNHYGVPLMKYWSHVQHDFTLRGKTAGQFRYWQVKPDLELRWNIEAMMKYPEDYLKDTVPHEVGHLIVMILHREHKILHYTHHGYMWYSVMAILGAPANRLHKYKLTPARREHNYAVPQLKERNEEQTR